MNESFRTRCLGGREGTLSNFGRQLPLREFGRRVQQVARLHMGNLPVIAAVANCHAAPRLIGG